MSPPQRELEAKFAVTPEERQRLMARCFVAAADGVIVAPQRLRSIYFDTRSQALRRNGMSLRVRSDGTSWVQTLKLETEMKGGVSHPIEIETPVTRPAVSLAAVGDEALRRRLAKLIGADRLRAVFEVDVERLTQSLDVAEGGLVELSLDTGRVKAGRESRDICEAEFELKGGASSALLRAVDQVFGTDLPRLAEYRKSEVGYGLLPGGEPQPPEPAKTVLPAISSGRADKALAELLSPVIRQVLHNWTVTLLSDSPEGPHQLRVGLRRLRTLLRAFEPILDKVVMCDLRARLRDFGQLVGELRDADVQVVDIVAPVMSHGGWGVAAQPLHDLLVTRRDAIRQTVRRTLASGSYMRLKLELGLLPALLADYAAGQATMMSADKLGRTALGKAWKRAARRARDMESLSLEERHALRKDLKTLRYTVECFSGLYPPRRVADFTARLARLQDLFGYINDVASAQKLMAWLDAEHGQDLGARVALGYVIGWHTAKAEDTWKDAIAAWNAVRKTGRFWKD